MSHVAGGGAVPLSAAVLADATALLHLAFVVFVVLGGLLALRWPRAAWLHLPAVAWAAWVELAGWSCPLTPLENRLRAQAGRGAYAESFVEHHVLPLLYPAALSREAQIALGAGALVLNAAVYGFVWVRRH